MAENKVLTVGSSAQSFHDPSTGITIVRGEKKELTPQQYNSTRVRLALASGHLTLVVAPENTQEDEAQAIDKAVKKAKKLAKDGVTFDKMATKFDHDIIVKMAEKEGVNIEEGDTDATILEAIVSD